MNAVAWLNYGALAGALALSAAAAALPRSSDQRAPAGRQDAAARPVEAAAPEASPAALEDHAGALVPLRDFRRIASASTVADELLVELCEPDRVVAFTGYGARRSPRGYRYAGKARVEDTADVEALLALQPDLVILNGYGDPRRIARLREAGLTVYDLGPMRGLATLVSNAHEVAALVGHPERGRRLAAALVQGMAAVAADIQPPQRRRGMYLSGYGGRLFGGTAGTSYNDVLTSAGLIDAAAAAHRDWPEYTAEQVLTLDPDVLVTNTGMRKILCAQAGLERLRACSAPGGVVELDDALLGDPGPAMLEAAQTVRSAVYGAPAAPGAARAGGGSPARNPGTKEN
ncbi:ABC transporter substrate-binding protein [Sorangium sp. So ce513]|uniref:ABC transporter substrate-binding protein n=1 Tax=Sorangium sp. So ce513 TaxID=3133315 RepID=UPI003F643BEE